MSELRRFGIYHPIDGEINTTCNTKDYAYEYITSVEAESIVKTFDKVQDKNPEYQKLGRRNTSIGDLITAENRLYMFNGTGGFKKIPTTKPLYKSIMETDEAIIEILNRRHLSQNDIDELIDNCY